MLVALLASTAFAPPLSVAPRAAVGCTLRAGAVQAVEQADDKAVKAAASKLRMAAAAFGPVQKEAANEWLEKTLATGGFSSAALLDQRSLLFEKCVINDDGSSNCKTLSDALVDLQDTLADSKSPAMLKATATRQRLAKSKVNKAALGVRSAALKFGSAQKKQADTWVQRVLAGERTVSLMEESVALFGECELSEKGSKAPNKCEALSAALEGVRVAMGSIEDTRAAPKGVVVPVSQMTDMEYRKYKAGERVVRPR